MPSEIEEGTSMFAKTGSRGGIGIALFVSAAVCAAPAAVAAADTLVYRVSARIDGSSDFLILHRDTLQWHHAGTVAAPGRQAGNDDPTTISAWLNGTPTADAVAWLPAWSQPYPNEIRFEDFSSTLTGLTPPLPAVEPLSVDVTTTSGRGTVTLSQLPSAANDYTLIAKFADGFNGSAFLEGQITVEVPEPATAAFAGLAALGWLAIGRSPGHRRARP
jgi:hypothetical protein